jgi:predicted aspartyl protease
MLLQGFKTLLYRAHLKGLIMDKLVSQIHRARRPQAMVVFSCMAVLMTGALYPIWAADDCFARGVREYQNQNFAKAASIFEQCLAKQTNNSELYYYAAITYQRLGNFKKAQAAYQTVVKRFPGSQAAALAQTALKKPSIGKAPEQDALVRSYDPNLDTFPKETWVNFTHERNALIVDGAVNGRPTKLIFDTGAAATAFTNEQLAALGIPIPASAPTAMTLGIGSKGKVAARCITVDLKLGNIERRHFPVLVLANPLPYPLLGDNFYHDLQYTIDNDTSAIKFKYSHEQQAIAVSPRPVSAMTVSSSGNYVYNVPFTVENKSLIVVPKVDGHECPMIFDTGAEICVFSLAQLAEFGIRPHPTGKRVPLAGTSGQTMAAVCLIEDAKLGPISGPMICVVSQQSAVSKPLMGQSFFKDWQYTVDRANSVIQFVKK